MSRYLSPLVSGPEALRPDPIRSFVRKANELEKRTGRRIIRLNIGQPDLPPAEILRAYEEGLRDPRYVSSSSYPPCEGIDPLREAISVTEERCFGVEAEPSRFYITLGGCGALKFVFKVLGAGRGQVKELIAVAPGWGVISNFAWEYGIKVRFSPLISPNGEFLSDRAQEMVNGDTVGIYVNSPNNPTGGLMREEAVRDVLSFARDNDIWVISDEAYQNLVFSPNERHISFASFKDYSDRVFKCISFSKVLKPNSRLGALLLPEGLGKDVMDAFFVALRNEGAGVSAEVQSGALRVLEADPELLYMNRVNKGYREKVSVAKNLLEEAGCRFSSYNEPKAGFYVFPEVPVRDSLALTERLLEGGASVVPGVSFHLDSHIRIAVGNNMSLEQVREGLERITRILSQGL